MIINTTNGSITLENGFISSTGIKQECPYCRNINCYGHCDGSQGDIDGLESEEQTQAREISNAAIDGLESLLLSLSDAGIIKPDDPRLPKAIETSLDAIANNLG